MHYQLDPDVAGGFGELTEVDTRTVPLTVHRLHYEFAAWFGDCLVTSFPSFILEESAAKALADRGFGGFEIRDVIISKSDQFEELLPGVELPRFVWLHVTGVPGVDDLGILPAGDLVVSEEVLAILRKHGLENCEVESFKESGEPT